jgi:SAM-dependent methyltransferase
MKQTIKNLLLVPKRMIEVSQMDERPWFTWLVHRIKDNTDILDICGGYGLFYYGLLKTGVPIRSYTCVDNHHPSITQGRYLARIWNANARFYLHDVSYGLPFEADSYTSILMMSWWLPGCYQYMIDEALRVLHDNGDLYLMFPDWMQGKAHVQANIMEQKRFQGFDKVWFTMNRIKKQRFPQGATHSCSTPQPFP